MRSWLLVVACILSISSYSQQLPAVSNPPRLVNDFVGILTPSEQVTLEHFLSDFNDSTSNQINIVIISTLNGYPIEEYSNKLFREWGIGSKEKNNGILILVASQDRKIRIEVGYGLEGAIPDIIANEIINNDLKPNFKNQAYYQGFVEAVQDLAIAAKGEYNIKKKKVDKDSVKDLFKLFFIIIIIIILLSIFGRKNRGGGGSSGMTDLATGMLIGSMLGGGRRSGGWSSGDSGFGGFGGFGGGSSGGGGASGSW